MIDAYIESKRNSWSPSTCKSELARLKALEADITGCPETLWKALESKAPYTRVTAFTRVASYWTWVHPGPNPYDVWRKTHANKFKHAYQQKRVPLSFDVAKERINNIKDLRVRMHALAILASAQRWCESTQRGEYVVGKGGKTRPNLRPTDNVYPGSYSTFLRKLKKACGLTPHDLRKLALSRMVDKGATAADLQQVAGWNSISTANWYLQPKETDRLKKLLE